jgi:hypothetical protein
LEEDNPDEQGLESQFCDVDGRECQQKNGKDDIGHHHAEGCAIVVQQQA